MTIVTYLAYLGRTEQNRNVKHSEAKEVLGAKKARSTQEMVATTM